jgi:hypothetical protein
MEAASFYGMQWNKRYSGQREIASNKYFDEFVFGEFQQIASVRSQ